MALKPSGFGAILLSSSRIEPRDDASREDDMTEVGRRQLLKIGGAAALAGGLPAGGVGGVYAGNAPEQLRPMAVEATGKGAPMTFAMTHPPVTRGMSMHHWLAAGGINPDRDVSLIAIPPAHMVANMKVGKMDGYCVGEPWGARAIADGIGFTAITTQQIWKDHPEKVLGFTEEFATKNPKTVKAVMRAILEASQWNDKLENRPKMAEVVGQPQYGNAAKEINLGRMLRDYNYGDERIDKDKYYMTFFDRQTNFPLKSHGVWWLSQFRRWGMVKEPPDYKGLVDRVHRADIFREVAQEMSVEMPRDDMKKETLFDGVTFDPADPEKYAKGFAVHSMA